MQSIPFLCASNTPRECELEDSTDPSGVFVAAVEQMIIGPSALPGDSGSGILHQVSLDAGTFDFFLRAGAELAAERGGYPVPAWALD